MFVGTYYVSLTSASRRQDKYREVLYLLKEAGW